MEVNSGLRNPNAHALLIDPTRSDTLYAGVFGSSVLSGIFRSTNGGTNWTEFNPGIFRPLVFALAVDAFNAKKAYAGISGGVFTIQLGPGPSISTVTFNAPKRVTITGSSFTLSARVLINGKDSSGYVITALDSTLELKGKPKKLGLRPGLNVIQVFDSNNLPSNEYMFWF